MIGWQTHTPRIIVGGRITSPTVFTECISSYKIAHGNILSRGAKFDLGQLWNRAIWLVKNSHATFNIPSVWHSYTMLKFVYCNYHINLVCQKFYDRQKLWLNTSWAKLPHLPNQVYFQTNITFTRFWTCLPWKLKIKLFDETNLSVWMALHSR